MAPHEKIRRISPTEQVYLSMNMSVPPCAIQLWLEADTQPSQYDLEQALILASQKNIGARLIVKGRWWVDSGISPKVRKISSLDRPSHSNSVFHESFLCEITPPIEVIVWEGQGLIFRCSHALMDAGGLLFFAEETFRALRNESLLGSGAITSDYEFLCENKDLNQRPLFTPIVKSLLGSSTGGGIGYIWESRFISGKVSAVSARIASSLSKLAHERDVSSVVRFMFPVDLRYLNSNFRTTGNFSNPLFLESKGEANWNEYYRQTLDGFSRQDELAISKWDALVLWFPRPLIGWLLELSYLRQIRKNRCFFTGVISHVGTVALKCFSAKNFSPKSARFMPFDNPFAAISLVSVQHDDGLEVSVSCPDAIGNDGLGKVLDRICFDLECGSYDDLNLHLQPSQNKPIVGEAKLLPPDLTVSNMFALQASQHPNRRAVSDEHSTITYAELNELAQVCAFQLKKRGVGLGDKVAVLSGKSSDTIIALLGIMRMGATFVPLDPEWPIDRINFVIEDCRPTCVVLSNKSKYSTTASQCVQISELCKFENEIRPIGVAQSHDSVAYILYTSGSTGSPKGVVVGQKSLVNYLLWAQGTYLNNIDIPVFPFFTSIAFDLTLTSIFLPLVTGGEIRVVQQQDPLVAAREILADSLINAVKLTPSHLWIFWGCGIAGSGLRKFIVGGEALPTKLAYEIFLQSTEYIEIFNEYGPTEATIGCVVHRYDPQLDLDAYIPIGRPIANTEVLLLDETMQFVSLGEPGEIYLAGECLALGYLKRPKEDNRFTQNPFRDGIRIYRTGDRARLSSNGNLEYLGRTDSQIKIRGHRVEIGEVESAIEASGLCLTFVVAQESTSSGTGLAAFVSWRAGASKERLESFLRDTLPAYMCPSRIVEMDQLPLNINGKIDKSHLPIRVEDFCNVNETCAIEDIESVLIQLIKSLPDCSLRNIPLDKSLLELGFDSLQMTIFLSLVERRFLSSSLQGQFIAELGDFVALPTVRNLANHLRTIGVSKFDSKEI